MKKDGRQKAFGQNFLINQNVISTIIDSVDRSLAEFPVQWMLEIGPGHGALTLPWVEKYPNLPLTLIEKDNLIAHEWKKRSLPQITLINDDATEVNYDELIGKEPVGVFSNLPYSVGTTIFTTLAEHPNQIRFMILMFQKEVAERILLAPGTVGSLGLWSQNVWDIQKVILVPPTAFKPKPKIDSLVIKCVPRVKPRVPLSQSSHLHKKLWQDLLKVAFSHRRKMLRSIFNQHPLWKKALADSQVPETLRAEALNWSQWEALFSAACSHSGLR